MLLSVSSLGLSRRKVEEVSAPGEGSSGRNKAPLDDQYLKDSRLKVLRLFDSIFLLEQVPSSSFLEFLKLHVSEKCALVVQEYTRQHSTALLTQQRPPLLQLESRVQVDVEKISVLYGRPVPQSYLKILGLLRFQFQSTVNTAHQGAEDMSAHCYLDRCSASLFLTRYLLSSSIKQSTVGRILKLSQVFVFNDSGKEEKGPVAGSLELVSGEEKVRRIETVVIEAEAVIANIKRSLEVNIDERFALSSDGLGCSVGPDTNDRSLSSCIHSLVMATEDIQIKVATVEAAVQGGFRGMGGATAVRKH